MASSKPSTTQNQPFADKIARKQIRGSSLLMFGRVISVGLNFATQVLLVRYLIKADYGAWEYALAAVAFFEGFSSLGLKRSISRFIPIYHEKGEYNKLFGTIVLTVGIILLIGAIVITAIYISPETITRLISGGKQQPVNLILIMIFMVPVDAIDQMLIGLFASLASPRTILIRRHVVAPGLRLAVVVLLILFESSVFFLAYGYLISSILGVLVFVWVFIRLLERQGILQHFQPNSIKIPAKEIFAFTIPLLTSDLVTVIMHSADTLILGYFHDTTVVASYRVVLHPAHFNKLVMMSFAILYMPLAARLFAKNDYAGINDLYWRTAVWLGY